MESRAFIKHAATLIEKIEANPAHAVSDDTATAVQKEIGQLFAGLHNPTLPSAYRLRDAALKAGYAVSGPVQQRLAQFENLA
jgi:hypothetical protein